MGYVIAESFQVARKEHTCEVCLTAIEPGTRYRRTFMTHDGPPYSWVEHEECARVGFEALDTWLDDGYTAEMVAEHLAEISPDDMSQAERLVWWRIESRRAAHA